MQHSLPDGVRVYAIGDIHGLAWSLDMMLGAIEADAADNPFDGTLIEVFLGDYVDRGADSFGVIERLMRPPGGGRTRVCLRGNHEQALMDAAHDLDTMVRWMTFGGGETMKSYGVDVDRHAHDPQALQPLLEAALPERHRAFLHGLPRSHTLGDVLFVHAGIRPGVALDNQDPNDLIWIREPFLSDPAPLPAHIVHGHTPTDDPFRDARRTNVDTGAVYGGMLTAAVLEGDTARFLAVPGAR
ncbi:MAG: metallophosphoesterase family protein [Pseudomonadota bacterium]